VNALFGIMMSTAAIQATAAAAPSTALVIPEAEWQPMQGDRFIVDTKNNEGYLIHSDGSYTEFDVATGRRHVVHYLGLTYDATTPVSRWQVHSIEVTGDRITFGPEGHFLRLFKNGDEYTSYGIHDYAFLNDVLDKDTEGRYFSMGCVLVRKSILNLLEKTLDLNGNNLDVVTTYGLNEALVAKQ
jgi:hypothetical protein